MSAILVIDDEAALREEVVDWLTFEDYEAVGVADGLLGIDYAFQHPVDLIICDITMPGLDGYGVLLEIRSNPATADLPFIFVTARASHEDIRTGMSSGADDYITKPFTRLELLQAVKIRIEKKNSYESSQQYQIAQLEHALAQEHEDRLVKSKLVAMFAHDFRNSLTSIMASNSLLRDYSARMDDKHRLTHMNQIESSSRLLIQMLDEMLLMAQMETGNLQIRPESLEIQQFLQQIVDEFQGIYSVTHKLTFESNFNGTVMLDARLVRQVAANLISNAVKYSPRGSEVHITLDSDDSHIILRVQDRGIGISEADQTNLFDSFKRGSNVGKIGGTGLGLSIVKQAVDLHGGSIHLQSQVDVGTTVSVTFPLIVSV